jgi:hypothetical protein
MSSAALNNQGAVLKRGDGAGPEVFTSIGAIEAIKGPDMSMSFADVVDLDSTWEEVKAVLPDGGEVSVDLFLNPSANTQHAGIWTDFTGKVLRNWQIVDTGTTPNQTTWSFAAYISKLPPQFAKKDVQKATVTLRISGAVTKTAA